MLLWNPIRPDLRGSCGTCTRCIEACPTDAIIEPNLLDSPALYFLSDDRVKGEHTKGTSPQDRELDFLVATSVKKSVHGTVRRSRRSNPRFSHATETSPLSYSRLSI